MSLYLENNIWRWSYLPVLNFNTIYKTNDKYITILYIKSFPKIKNEKELIQFNHLELISYINVFGFSNMILITYNGGKTLCDICGIVTHINYKIKNFNTYVCQSCKEKTYPGNYFINTRPGDSNTMINMVERKIDVTVVYKNKIHFLYHVAYKIDKFNYKTILYEPWYQRDGGTVCVWCNQNQRHFNSMCKACFDFSYQSTFKFVIMAWLGFEFLHDTRFIIFTYLLKLLDYNFELNDFYKKTKVIKIINDNNNDENEELITEDNLYNYIKFDLNSSEEESCELGYWSD